MSTTFNYNDLGANIPDKAPAHKGDPLRKVAHDFAFEVLQSRKQIADALTVSIHSGVITEKELRELFGKHISSIYRYKNAELDIPSEVLIPLIRVMAERGCTELLNLMVPKGYTVVRLPETPLNGLITDEVVEDVKELGDVMRAFEKGDMKRVCRCAGTIVTETLEIIEEAETIREKAGK